MNQDWENSHFYTQKKGDITKPTMCSHCGGELKEVEKGWQCERCMCLIDGVSFYQGRNSKEKEIIIEAKEIIKRIKSEAEEHRKKTHGFEGMTDADNAIIEFLIETFEKKGMKL